MPAHVCEISNNAATDQDDEALNRWKASLGLGSGTTISDPNDPRKCVIKSLALVRLPFNVANVPELTTPKRKLMVDPTLQSMFQLQALSRL